jgi:hypothetical protein
MSAPAVPAIHDDLGDVDILRGLLYAHSRANSNTRELCRTAATVEALVELLANGGVLDQGAVEELRESMQQRLQGEYLRGGMGVAMQEFDVSKYAFDKGVEIDCENRLPLCKAACCKLPFALSAEDVHEGVIRWDLGSPYLIAHGGDGYCVHMDRCTHQCGVYDQRPIPCRGYDCRRDTRIWLDFDERVVNPRIDEPDWPACLSEESPPRNEEGVNEPGCSTTSTAR